MVEERKYTPNENVASIHQIVSFSWLAFAAMAFLLVLGFWKEGSIIRWIAAFGGVSLVLGGLHYLIAEGARKKQGWARVASIVYAIAVLPGFPVFTFIGIFLLKHMRWDETAASEIKPDQGE